MNIAVVGGGAIGLCTAEALAARGASVTVLEAGRCGAAASAGNAGWITPGLSSPIPAPGTMAQAARWMLNPSSPLLIRPSVRPSFLRWSYRFWRSTPARRHQAGMAALVALADRAIPEFEALAERGVAFELHRDGLLFLALSERQVEAERRSLADQGALGYGGGVEVFDGDEVRRMEPIVGEAVAGGVLARDEAHVRPETLTAGLVEHLRAGRAEVREQTSVARVVRERGRWRVVLGDGGEALTADRVVIATGADAERLLPDGVPLPMQGAKGYSVTDDAPAASPGRPLYLLEAKVGVSPYDGALRLAGTLELGSDSDQLSRRRVEALDAAGARYFADWRPSQQRTRWAGFRPLLPDGLPAIGPVPGHDGLFVATGHAMLGITLAPATGAVLAPAVLGDRPSLELAPFSVARFAGRRRGAEGAAA